MNHELFLKKNRAQATSLKLQATGGGGAATPTTSERARSTWVGGSQKVQAPGVGGPIVHKQLIHRLSTEKIFNSLLMGFSMKKWEHEKSKNYCSCEPTHDQVQPETRHGVSGSNSEAQRQNLLRSRSALLRLFKNPISATQTSKLWGCVLGGDRGERDSLRLDRGSPGQAKASLHQVKASDGSPTWKKILDRLRNIHHSLQPRNLRKNYRSISLNQVRPDLGIPPNLKTHKQQALKHQA